MSVQVDPSWYQGRGAFGGLQAAWLVQAMERLPEVRSRPLRTISVHCCAPVTEGVAELRAEALRMGSAVTHAEARLLQGGVAATAVATFANARREGPSRPAPAAPDRAEFPPIPRSPLFPTFTAHVEFRFAQGGLPYSGHADARVGGRARFVGGMPRGAAGLVALSDAWPPSLLPTFTRPQAVATVDWTTSLLHIPDDVPEDA